MSHLETHRLCNKLEKWINNSCNHHHHSKNSQTEGTHLHYNAKNIKNYCSPYKKTSFETLLRKYPKNEQETKNYPKPTFQKQSQQNYGLKRTFQSRMMNFHNVKSKIDTNLNALKQLKMKQNISCPNDQNKNMMNINLMQQQVEKEMIQNNLRKKIKLNTGQYENYQVKKSYIWVQNDENNQSLMNRTIQSEGIKESKEGKELFKINLSKRINMLDVNNLKDNLLSIQGQKQTPSQQSEEIDGSDKMIIDKIEIEGRQNEVISERQNQVMSKPFLEQTQLPFLGQPLLLSSGETRLVLKQLKQEKGEYNESEDQAEDGIFCFDGYRVMEDIDHQQPEENNYNSLYTFQPDAHHYIPVLETISVEIIDPMNYLKHQLQEKDQIQPIIPSNYETITLTDNQLIVPTTSQQPQLIPESQSYSNLQNPPQIIQQSHLEIIQQSHPQNTHHQFNNLPIDHTTIQVQHKEKQTPFMPKFQRPKREKKSKDNTKILTRSKEDKLLLFNKFSMRLIRKKYGQDLTHAELVQKLLQDEGRIHLKAVIQDHQRKTVFEFNELTETQVKTILMKYFLQEQSKNEETE